MLGTENKKVNSTWFLLLKNLLNSRDNKCEKKRNQYDMTSFIKVDKQITVRYKDATVFFFLKRIQSLTY